MHARHVAIPATSLPGLVARTRPFGEIAPRTGSCATCSLNGACLPSQLTWEEEDRISELANGKRRIARGAALYRAGDAFHSLYIVRTGSFKGVRVSQTGEEKVTGFYLPTEMPGLNAIHSERHSEDIVALEDSVVCEIPYAALTELMRRIPRLQTYLFRRLSGDIMRDQGLMLLIGNMTAEQRVFAFLLSLSRRYESMGYAADRFQLRMTRDDIGSYLGLSLETISRVLTKAHRDGLLTVRKREIGLVDLTALQAIVGEW